jgi:eukaryotic-like serine/threonine-protein kinase
MFAGMLQDSATLRGNRQDRAREDQREEKAASRRRTLCGWTVERSLGRGVVCESLLVSRGGERAVARLLQRPFAQDAQTCADWLRACWTANRFQHALVTRVLEQGTDGDGTPVVVRAFAPGETLAGTIERSRPELPAALELAAQVLDVLEIAHSHGVVHGGISPHNIVVAPQGSARVVDFGHYGHDRIAAVRVGPFTAPERLASSAAAPTEAGDIWSVGACIRAALAETAIPADVEAVLSRSMALDPRDRYPSAYALLGDLRRVLGGRRPKLRDSAAPVPSVSLVGVPLLAAAAVPASPPAPLSLLPARQTPAPAQQGREWVGNLLLVMAIAALVGLATFVLVRERLGDSTRHRAPSSSSSSETR